MTRKGGNIVDAGIASLICLGVYNIQSAGVGGGGFLVYHDRATNRTHLVDSREVAPRAAYKDMYKHRYDAAVEGEEIFVYILFMFRSYYLFVCVVRNIDY